MSASTTAAAAAATNSIFRPQHLSSPSAAASASAASASASSLSRMTPPSAANGHSSFTVAGGNNKNSTNPSSSWSSLTAVGVGTGNPLLRFFDNSKTKKLDDVELEDRTGRMVKLVPHFPTDADADADADALAVVGDYDVCREYSYSDEDDVYDPSSTTTTTTTTSPLRNATTVAPASSMIWSLDAASIAIFGMTQQQQQQQPYANNGLEAHQQLVQQQASQLPWTFMLGKAYHPLRDYAARRDDESSLFWFTYRTDFPEIAPYQITSDAGWGCMLRSAQMLLAQTIKVHFKSRDWKPATIALSKRRQDPLMRSILTWFADFCSTTESVYSLHNMVAAGLKYDKLPGEWYGPATVCHVLRDLVELHQSKMPKSQQQQQQQLGSSSNTNTNSSNNNKLFRVHVASQGTVYREEIAKLMTTCDATSSRNEDSSTSTSADHLPHGNNQQQPTTTTTAAGPAHPLDLDWEEALLESSVIVADDDGDMNGFNIQTTKPKEWDTALLLLIPLRLGLKKFNEDYAAVLAFTFSLPQSVGVLGGRPRGARWFYGATADGTKILGLDPHTVQAAPRRRIANVNGKTGTVVDMSDDYLRSVHTTYPEVFSLQRMDPSIAMGFYCRTASDLDHVLDQLLTFQKDHPSMPELFTIQDTVPDYSASDMMLQGGSSTMSVGNKTALILDDIDHGDIQSQHLYVNDEEDEYVML